MHLILTGAPGCGKGTYAQFLKESLSIPHISTGEIFREAISKETKIGLIAKTFIDKGNLVPDEVTNEIVKERLSRSDCEKGFILDGFPRTLVQAKALSKIMQDLNLNIDAVLDLEVEDSVVIERIINRRNCPICKKSYNLITMAPKKYNLCDDCGVTLIQRKDDVLETITSRLQVYHIQTEPIIEYYKQLGILFPINANQSVQKVLEDIKKELTKI